MSSKTSLGWAMCKNMTTETQNANKSHLHPNIHWIKACGEWNLCLKNLNKISLSLKCPMEYERLMMDLVLKNVI